MNNELLRIKRYLETMNCLRKVKYQKKLIRAVNGDNR